MHAPRHLLLLLALGLPLGNPVWAAEAVTDDPADLLAPVATDTAKAETPSAEAVKAVVANLKELFQAEYATSKTRSALASTMTDQALQTENDPVMRYALLHEARELAIGARDVATVIVLCEQIAATYQGPTAAEQQRALLPRLSSVPVVASLLKLLDAPSDAYANTVAGRWYAVEVEDWERALPLLARGSDAILTKAASAELNAPSKASERTPVADQWYDLGKRTSATKQPFWRHALTIYEAAKPELTGVSLALVEKRIAEIEAYLPLGDDIDYDKLSAGQWEKLKGRLVTVDAGRGVVASGLTLARNQKVRVVPHPTDTWSVTDNRGTVLQATWKGGMAGRRALGSLQCRVGDGTEQTPGIVSGTGPLVLFALVPNARRFQVTGTIRVKILPVAE
jgi:hypothetical protein